MQYIIGDINEFQVNVMHSKIINPISMTAKCSFMTNSKIKITYQLIIEQ